MTERVVYHESTQRQLDVLFTEPEARDIFNGLSEPVQQYLYLNWLKASPTISRDERKSLSAQTAHLATQLFGEENKDKGYNRELQRYSNVVWMEVWQEDE